MISSVREQWIRAMNPEAGSLIKYVRRANEILCEEGYHLVKLSQVGEAFARACDDGSIDTVFMPYGATGMMAFVNSAAPHDGEDMMAWDYIKTMRPNVFRRSVNYVKHKLGFGS